MHGKILEINNLEVLVSLGDNSIVNISISRLPNNLKVGDYLDLSWQSLSASISDNNFLHDRITNNKLVDFF